MNPESRLLIDGELVPAASGKTYPNISPVTEEVIGHVADAGPEDMERAIALGIDGLITDYPDRLRTVLAAKGIALPAPMQ